jgi:hypothetical protein
MDLTNLVNTLGLTKLFQKAEAGDAEAKKAIQAFNESPELTGAAFASPAKPDLDVPLMQQLPADLPTARTSPGLSSLATVRKRPEDYAAAGVGGDFQQAPKRDWGNLFDKLAVGAEGLANAFTNSRQGYDVAGGARQRLQASQMEQLKRKHQMWDTAYDASQGLPPEVIRDPQFASLAQAKAALDKDMLDGKVDNEKNVSLFLTELARFKPELDQLSMTSKAKLQVAGEGMLQKEREKAGLALPMEQREYNFEGSPVTRTEYLGLSSDRTKRAEERAFRLKQLEEQIAGRKDVAQIHADTRNDARQAAERAALLKRVIGVAQGAMQAKDPITLMPQGEQGLLAQEGALIGAADKLGIPFNKQVYAQLHPEERAQALAYLLNQLTIE